MAVWLVSHSKQLIADLVDGQFIKNPVFAKSHHDHVTVLSHLQMAIAEYAFRLALVVGRMTSGHGANVIPSWGAKSRYKPTEMLIGCPLLSCATAKRLTSMIRA